MSSSRLFHQDAYLARFEARVLAQSREDGVPVVILDRTAFYPTSGGQPHDTGVLRRLGHNMAAVEQDAPRDAEAIRVLDVKLREDGAIAHYLDAPFDGDRVIGAIDWNRRFDHMQQHTGQHILSRAFDNIAGAATVGFHLGDTTVTIDLDVADMSDATVAAVEAEANAIVWENRPLTARVLPRAEALALPLRKVPAIDGPTLRIVTIDAYDWNACGGTHVAQTGAVGMIKILRLGRQNRRVRVEFVCGGRAQADFAARLDIVTALTNAFTCGQDDLLPVVTAQREALKATQKRLRQLERTVASYVAADLVATAEMVAGVGPVAHRVFSDRPIDEVRQIASAVARDGVTALCGIAGDQHGFVFARSAAARGDMAHLLALALAETGGRGGGSARFAQGRGGRCGAATIADALAVAVTALRSAEEAR